VAHRRRRGWRRSTGRSGTATINHLTNHSEAQARTRPVPPATVVRDGSLVSTASNTERDCHQRQAGDRETACTDRSARCLPPRDRGRERDPEHHRGPAAIRPCVGVALVVVLQEQRDEHGDRKTARAVARNSAALATATARVRSSFERHDRVDCASASRHDQHAPPRQALRRSARRSSGRSRRTAARPRCRRASARWVAPASSAATEGVEAVGRGARCPEPGAGSLQSARASAPSGRVDVEHPPPSWRGRLAGPPISGPATVATANAAAM